jgi:2-methylcitrate dehydratase PrpD
MRENITDKFIDDLDALRGKPFSDSAVIQAKKCLLDYLGATFAGARMLEEKGNELLHSLGDSEGDVAVIGFNKKASVMDATLINGLSAHIAELDDGVRFGVLHPGAPIFSALLPVAQNEKIAGTDFLTGVIIGYEAAIRIASAMQPNHYSMGYHPTATCGSIGAAIGVGAMLGFSKAQMKDALSSVAISSSGMLKVIEDGSDLKPFNSSRAALTGLLSSFMARAGFKGLDDVLAGPIGFLAMMAKEYDVSHLERKDEDSLRIEQVYFKPYASCRHTHPAIEAALRIKQENSICVEDIKSIKITTYKGVIGKHDHTEIRGVASAKMSIPFSTALAIVVGKAGLDDFSDETVNNAQIIALTNKTVVCADEKISSLVPQKRAAIVAIEMFNGTTYSERVDFPRGEPENPLSEDEIKEKFIALAMYGNKSEEECREIIEVVWNIQKEAHNLFSYL